MRLGLCQGGAIGQKSVVLWNSRESKEEEGRDGLSSSSLPLEFELKGEGSSRGTQNTKFIDRNRKTLSNSISYLPLKIAKVKIRVISRDVVCASQMSRPSVNFAVGRAIHYNHR